MDITKNTHYQNEHGKQLKDYMKEKSPEVWRTVCQWSALKYNIRAGKKEGESLEKDLGKRDDYINEALEIDDWFTKEEMLTELSAIKHDFENWKG